MTTGDALLLIAGLALGYQLAHLKWFIQQCKIKKHFQLLATAGIVATPIHSSHILYPDSNGKISKINVAGYIEHCVRTLQRDAWDPLNVMRKLMEMSYFAKGLYMEKYK